jgi:hypothetical protein
MKNILLYLLIHKSHFRLNFAENFGVSLKHMEVTRIAPGIL